MARPEKEINADLVRGLAAIHCTYNEIAAVCDCSVDTLERRFADIIEKGKEEGRISLRRLQWQSAEGTAARVDPKSQKIIMPAILPSITMQIWLGKQMLAQKDQMQLEALGKDGAALRAAESGDTDYSQLSVDELLLLEKLNSKALRRPDVALPAGAVEVKASDLHDPTTNGNGSNGNGTH